MKNNSKNLPTHIAIIMDGNRRWAREKGMKATEGHKVGAETLEKIVSYCNTIGIKFLTVYAFSTENWKRGKEEVGVLMGLLRIYLEKLFKRASSENVRIRIIGDIEAFEEDIKKSIIRIMERTKENTGLTVNIALNYGGRSELLFTIKNIAEKVKSGILELEDISEELVSSELYTTNQPDPDLLIRTSGEQRISNFLLWQIAYSEMYFINKYWPDFNNNDLDDAINEYNKRNRRFGGK